MSTENGPMSAADLNELRATIKRFEGDVEGMGNRTVDGLHAGSVGLVRRLLWTLETRDAAIQHALQKLDLDPHTMSQCNERYCFCGATPRKQTRQRLRDIVDQPAAGVAQKRTLVVVGGIGQKHAYLDVSKKDAVRRFKASEGYVLEGMDPPVEEFDFVDEFWTYDVGALEGR